MGADRSAYGCMGVPGSFAETLQVFKDKIAARRHQVRSRLVSWDKLS
ncbi:MAG: hypothetical protein V3V57_06415 [Spirochaetia bacterium]